MTTTTNGNRFQKGSGVYTCRDCGKRTRATGHSEQQLGVCRACFDEAGVLNEHEDGHHDDEPRADCPACREEN